MSETVEKIEKTPLLERLAPGQTAQETQAMLGKGSLVFLGGMATAAAAFFVERAVVNVLRKG